MKAAVMKDCCGAAQVQLVPYQPAHATGVRLLFIQVNGELAPVGMERAFSGYVARALRDEIDDIAGFYSPGRGNGFWVLLCDGTVAGMVGIERVSPDTAELRRMYLSATCRGLGLAERLLMRAEEEARQRGYSRMILSTSEVQRRALSFYRRAGYRLLREEVATTQSHKVAGNGLRRYHFEKALKA